MLGPGTDAVVAQLVAMYARFQQQSSCGSSWASSTSDYYAPSGATQQANAMAGPCIAAIHPGQPFGMSPTNDMGQTYYSTPAAPAGRTLTQPLGLTPCTAGTTITPLQPSMDRPGTLPTASNQPVQPVSLVSAGPPSAPFTAPMPTPADDHPDYLPLLMAALSSPIPPAPAAAGIPATPAAANSNTSTTASGASVVSHLDPSSIANSSFRFGQGQMMVSNTGVLQGSNQLLQEQSTLALPAVQHLQLNGVQPYNSQQSIPNQSCSTMLSLSHLLAATQQQHGISCLAPSVDVSMAGQLLLNQLTAAGTIPGTISDLPASPLEAARAAAAAAAVMAQKQNYVSAAAVEATKSSIPNRHAYRSDGSINTLYKTQICKTWATTGDCKYEERCQFAHGNSDLRSVYRPAKYKTVPCRNRLVFGHCPFGERCNFIHEEDDGSVTPASSITASPTAVSSFSSRVSSRRSSGCEGFMPAATAACGSFAGQTPAPSWLAHELRCNQMTVPVGLNSHNLGGWRLGAHYPSAADLAFAGAALAGQMPSLVNAFGVGNDYISNVFGAT